ncbi:MAG: DNA repair protein RecN [Planctomycetota bacterium]
MLVHLRVRDLVLIDDLDLPLSPGFNVLTGETGAGKSLVATAIHLLLGRKTKPDIVRRGADEAAVEGLFDVSDEPGVRARLADAGYGDGDELLVRRIVPAEGRQRCFVNGRLASLALLADLADGLASFASQHEHLALLDPARQLALVDDFGTHGDRLDAMTAAHAAASAARARYDDLLAKERDRAQRLDWLAFQVEEIDRTAPGPDELDALEVEAGRLRHGEQLLGATRGAADGLYESDGSVYERIATFARELEAVAAHDPVLAGESSSLLEAAGIVEEAARRLADYASRADADPERLEEVEERRGALLDLTKKHGMDLAELVDHVETMRSEVEELSRYEEAVEEARATLAVAREEAAKCAAALTAARKRAAKKLTKAVTAELSDLGLGGGRFEIAFTVREGDPGPVGADRAEFLVSLNPGEGTHPLRQVASGGELSRLMLGIRRALSGVGPAGTHVFDEVDSGIGGAVASAVGRKLAEVAEHHQVVCVTHLPQIAGLPGTHFLVAKGERKGRTLTEVRRLDEEERVQEVARMLGGETLTEKTKAAARELLAG